VPKFFNSNLSAFIHLFDIDNYVLRNCITEILGNIIKHVFLLFKVFTDTISENDNPAS